MRKKILLFINNRYVQVFLYNPFSDYIVWSILSFIKIQAKKIPKTASVLDAGAGELRYKKYFDHCKYISQDLCVGDKEWYFDNIDIKSNIYNIPVENESFDYILCAQVLEHLEFPELAFKEFSRILKKNGKLLLTAPLGQGEHQIPYDFFRYTKYGLDSLGKRNGLNLIYIKPAGGIFINLEYILWQAKNIFVPFKKFFLTRYFFYVLFLPLKYISGIIFVVLDIFDRKKIYTNNYNCIYEKN
jgi:SAM-dependent methyltransferase